MTENTNIRLTAEAWADITIERWLDKQVKLQVGWTGALKDIGYEIHGTHDTVSQIGFSYEYYGKFVDMGVGKGVKLEDVKSSQQEWRQGVGGSRRRAKKWYSRTFYSEVKALTEILAQKYPLRAAITIVENLDDNALKWMGQTI